MATQPGLQPMAGERLGMATRWMVVVAALLLVSLAVVLIVDVARDADVAPASVSLSATDDGRDVRVALDGTVAVQLDSNPSTGYSWAVDTIDAGIVTLESDMYTAPSNGAVGQGGTQELRFRAAGTGQTEVSLKYWRPWEGDASVIERFTVTVTVAER